MESLSAWFDRELFGGGAGAAVVTVIGSGGKTSLIWLLARYFARTPRDVLVTTTTKMFPPAEAALLPGISVAGRLNRATGKLEAPPVGELAERIAAYDLTLIEGDGSRGLPLKGWAEHEPAVPPFTTMTVGILPLWPLGKPASAELIHRLPLFRALTGAGAGEALKTGHLVKVIAGEKKNLFTAACGRKVLFLNQIEDEGAASQAQTLAALLPGDFPARRGIIAGSVRQDRIVF
ncbi:MAG: putative selenium-dependent hydroxylase accessory protein YqeC [Treponema sp.]|jgi:probable selenium-dependent hydroxylase accessory protein YqeC|nr:putative selenium-dependent hydroxylase accessory protein YqeC [Treponema sp.]